MSLLPVQSVWQVFILEIKMDFINTKKAPAAVGPYSQAVVVNGTVYCSGQIPLVPETGELIGGDIVASTRRALTNLFAVVEAAGASIEGIAKVTIFVRDMGQFKTINGIYEEFFGNHRPARAVVEVSKLPLDAEIEMDCVAYLK